MTKRQSWTLRVAAVLAVALGIVGSTEAQAPAPPAKKAEPAPEIEPKADATLKRMSDFLASQQAFSLSTESVTQVVLESGQKLDFVADSSVTVQRPNKMRTDRKGQVADLSLYYDGKALTLFGRRMNYYATTQAPPKLDEAIDFARAELDIEAPAADLLYENPYEMLMEDVVSGKYVGLSDIDGKKCHHLAFRGNETDWQIWIEDGPRPLPRKFVIVSKKVEGAPQFEVTIGNWNLAPKISPAMFTFVPPPKAERIDFVRHGKQKQTRR